MKHLLKDFAASIVVFLVALPLCLGIALASGAPLLSGLIAGIIGGLVVGSLSSSPLSVSGPAAGLVVIVLNAIETLGSFEAFLLSVFIAGVIQLLLGVAKAGIIGLYFPSSVIKGMLAAIGLILILKQIPHLVGFDADAFGEMEFIQADDRNTISYLLASMDHLHIGASMIGLFSLLIMIIWDQPLIKHHKILKVIPGGVLAVASGVILNILFSNYQTSWEVSDSHLVNLLVFKKASDLSQLLTFPDFTSLTNYNVYLTAGILAIVASLETLLSVEAIDKLDPEKRRTPKNRELRAQGIGNMIAGLVGGLPITAVIVRSSANLEAGATSKASTIFHGILLIAAITLFPSLMNHIPLASLAAILILVGYKLTKPSLYQLQWKLGKEQFIPFLGTIAAILFTDLLIGIAIGLAIGIFFILKANHRIPYHYQTSKEKNGERDIIHITLSEHVSFLNKASLLVTLEQIAKDAIIIIDGNQCKDIHYDALEVIYNFTENAQLEGSEVHLKNIPPLRPTTLHEISKEHQV